MVEACGNAMLDPTTQSIYLRIYIYMYVSIYIYVSIYMYLSIYIYMYRSFGLLLRSCSATLAYYSATLVHTSMCIRLCVCRCVWLKLSLALLLLSPWLFRAISVRHFFPRIFACHFFFRTISALFPHYFRILSARHFISALFPHYFRTLSARHLVSPVSRSVSRFCSICFVFFYSFFKIFVFYIFVWFVLRFFPILMFLKVLFVFFVFVLRVVCCWLENYVLGCFGVNGWKTGFFVQKRSHRKTHLHVWCWLIIYLIISVHVYIYVYIYMFNVCTMSCGARYTVKMRNCTMLLILDEKTVQC